MPREYLVLVAATLVWGSVHPTVKFALAELTADKPVPALRRLCAYRVEHASAADLVEKLTHLEISVRLSAFDTSNTIVALGSEAPEIGIDTEDDLVRANERWESLAAGAPT